MLSQKYIKERLLYDSATGYFTWRARKGDEYNSWNKRYAGNVISPSKKQRASKNTYERITLDGKRLYAHRLAFVYVYGDCLVGEIDHINHIRTDNRIENLSMVSRQENQKNKSKYRTNKSGVSGVSFDTVRQQYRVNVYDKGKVVLDLRVKDFFEACCISFSSKIKYRYHCNHGE